MSISEFSSIIQEYITAQTIGSVALGALLAVGWVQLMKATRKNEARLAKLGRDLQQVKRMAERNFLITLNSTSDQAPPLAPLIVSVAEAKSIERDAISTIPLIRYVVGSDSMAESEWRSRL
jgi:hypothetical protein